MIAKILPFIFLLAGTGGGIGVSVFLLPGPTGSMSQKEDVATTAADEPIAAEESSLTTEFVKMNNQFVVPIVQADSIAALVVVSLILEIRNGISEEIYAREPKLRDAFLRVLFDHANMGGFQGAFTQADVLGLLRTALREVAQKEIGPNIVDVLIVDIIRKDT